MFKPSFKKTAINQATRDAQYNNFLAEAGNPTKRWEARWKKFLELNTNLPVNTSIHGYSALITAGFTYPVFMRRYPYLNNPLVQIIYQTFITISKPVNIIDVGAAIGDTAFLLAANIPGGINKMLCIDGDKEFFKYLQHNMQQFNFVTSVNTFLSDGKKQEKELVRTHAGTASAQGEGLITAKPLDEVLIEYNFTDADVLKIDVDGFDGKVLAGARDVLTNAKPNVIFEWHPILLKQTGNNSRECFDVLTSCNYAHFLFFTKFGSFSHYSFGINDKEISFLETLCIDGKFNYDWHYDVIALPLNTVIDMQQLATCIYAKNKKSAF